MPFFIKGKGKRQLSGGAGASGRSNKGDSKKIRLGSRGKYRKKGNDDEEIDSDLEGDTTVQNDYKYSSESDVEETAQEKRLRLAHKYLEEIEKEEKKRLETEDVDRDVIARRLKEELLEKAGRLRKNVADLYSGCGEFCVLRCKEHSRSITCLVISYDNQYIFSASDDYNIVKWSISEKKKLQVIKRDHEKSHKKKILALAISTDFKYLVSGDCGAKINVWNPQDMTYVHSFSGHKIDVTGLAFRKDSHQLFSCSTDKTVKVWNLDEMMYVETLFGHMNGVTAIDALARDRAVSSGGRDNTLRIWKITEESHLILNGLKESIDCVKLLNEDHIISGSDCGNVCLWSSNRKKPVFTLPEAHGINAASGTPNWVVSIGAYLHTDMFATGSVNGVIQLYKCDERLKSFSKLFEIKLEGSINSLSFTTDGAYLIAGVGQEHRIGRWHTIKSVKNSVILIPLLKKS